MRNEIVVPAGGRGAVNDYATEYLSLTVTWQVLGAGDEVLARGSIPRPRLPCRSPSNPTPRYSEEQQLLKAQLGVRLSETEARLFAFACRQGGASLTDAKAVTGRPGPEARKVLNVLAVQELLASLGDSDRYSLAEPAG